MSGYWTPDSKDLEGVEDTLAAFLQSQHLQEKKDWASFRKQVAGVKRGEDSLLFLYYFRFYPEIEADLVKRKTPGYDSDSWRKTPYLVFDGGDSIFRVLYDIKRKRFVWFECNG